MSKHNTPPTLAARLLIAVLLTTAAAAGWYAGKERREPTVEEHSLIDTAVPAALWQSRLGTVAGDNITLQQWQSHPLLLNYWATWCPPCRAEMPELAAASRDFPGVRFVGIGIDTADKIRNFSQEHPQPYPLLIGGNDALPLSQQLGNRQGVLPFTVLIDAQGRLERRQFGALSAATLQQWLAPYARQGR
jgi:thiol-disulfide isomerase/thioredoxin